MDMAVAPFNGRADVVLTELHVKGLRGRHRPKASSTGHICVSGEPPRVPMWVDMNSFQMNRLSEPEVVALARIEWCHTFPNNLLGSGVSADSGQTLFRNDSRKVHGGVQTRFCCDKLHLRERDLRGLSQLTTAR